jgi:hypothetical protein
MKAHLDWDLECKNPTKDGHCNERYVRPEHSGVRELLKKRGGIQGVADVGVRAVSHNIRFLANLSDDEGTERAGRARTYCDEVKLFAKMCGRVREESVASQAPETAKRPNSCCNDFVVSQGWQTVALQPMRLLEAIDSDCDTKEDRGAQERDRLNRSEYLGKQSVVEGKDFPALSVTTLDTGEYRMKSIDGKEGIGTGDEALHALVEVETSDIHVGADVIDDFTSHVQT